MSSHTAPHAGEKGGPAYGDRRAYVATQVRQQIVAGHLRPGELLNIDSLAHDLDVSATPVREALQTLRVEGFLVAVRGQGFSVASITADDISDVFLMHSFVAGELAARAALALDEAGLADILAHHHELLAAAYRGDKDRLETLNDTFHKAINAASASPRLQHFVSIFVKYVPRAFYAEIEGWPQATHDDHTAIVDALLARDPEAAREAMATHIAKAGALLGEHYRAITSGE